MESMRSGPLTAVFLVLAVVFAVAAVLYAFGVIGFLASDPGAPHHYKHAALLAVLFVASLVAANFLRPRAA